MSRSDGFGTADIAVGHLDDDKIRKLWRILGPDQAAMTEAVTTHLAVILASWGSGRRKDLEEALPIWLTPSATVVDALVSAGLLDGSKKVPLRSWNRHYSPAAGRREAARESGRLGGIRSGEARAKRPFGDPKATPNPSGRQAGPSLPSDSVRPSRGGARQGGAPRSPREIMSEAGGFAANLAKGGDDDGRPIG